LFKHSISFERVHPVVYLEIYNILVPSKNNTYKDQMFITIGLYLATCFGRYCTLTILLY